MIGVRNASVLLLSLCVDSALSEEADNDPSTETQAKAVSKQVYDKIQNIQDAIAYLESIGISATDIEPKNLQFSSTSFQDCTAQVEKTLHTSEELAIGRVSCLLRHPDDFRSEVSR